MAATATITKQAHATSATLRMLRLGFQELLRAAMPKNAAMPGRGKPPRSLRHQRANQLKPAINRSTPTLIEMATEAGVSAYITKPPRAGEIERAVTVALARHADLMELRRLNHELAERNAQLEQALDEIKTLRGILPICTFCKKVRNDKGYWERVDLYIRSHSELEFSHGVCPECLQKHYPEAAD